MKINKEQRYVNKNKEEANDKGKQTVSNIGSTIEDVKNKTKDELEGLQSKIKVINVSLDLLRLSDSLNVKIFKNIFKQLRRTSILVSINFGLIFLLAMVFIFHITM